MTRRFAVAGGLLGLLVAGLLALMAAGPPTGGGSAPSEGSADVGFARDMAVHHQQAVEMSFIIRDRTDDEDIRRLAYDIINTQANQRGMLLGWLQAWGRSKTSGRTPMAWMDGHQHYQAHDGALMPGMATNTQLDRLRKAKGRAAEVLYLQLMTAHHRGGIEMARAAAGEAGTDEVAGLAAGIVRSQESEIRLMADMLKQ
jgi:uncharacterized protein (DUF305 family)